MKNQRHTPSALEKRLEVSHLLPRLSVLSAVTAIVTLALCLGWPISKAARRAMLASGPLSNHHRLIDAACERCHKDAFRGTSNQQCEQCHTVKQHAETMPRMLAAHPELEARCASCHEEHHGARSLVPTDSPLCTGCHKRIEQLLPGTEQASFGDFDHHPEFAVHGWVGNPPVYRRVRLGEKAIRSDMQIKFSHKEHMALGESGKPKLVCGSCHETAEDNKTFRPVSFEHHCGRCHAIEFDDRLRGVHVPHGNQDNVLPFISAALTKLHFDAGETGEEARDKLEEDIRDDQVALYTEHGGCVGCHEIEEIAASDAPDKKQHYVVARPNIPERWMPASRFSHPTHRFVTCESCHAGRSESTSSADIILPGIARCRKCHADPPTPGKVASPCLQCHGYHAPSRSTDDTAARSSPPLPAGAATE